MPPARPCPGRGEPRPARRARRHAHDRSRRRRRDRHRDGRAAPRKRPRRCLWMSTFDSPDWQSHWGVQQYYKPEKTRVHAPAPADHGNLFDVRLGAPTRAEGQLRHDHPRRLRPDGDRDAPGGLPALPGLRPRATSTGRRAASCRACRGSPRATPPPPPRAAGTTPSAAGAGACTSRPAPAWSRTCTSSTPTGSTSRTRSTAATSGSARAGTATRTPPRGTRSSGLARGTRSRSTTG